ncbi:MAG: ABC-2 transporter permease [Clostridia bacterium]|nr:ABC-2 transporter permease [Clostridia bacterium]
MMRVLKFARVDLIKTWKFFYILFFPMLTVLLLARDPKLPAMFGVAYCLFVSIVLAAMPFNTEDRSESGFLQLLPAKPGEQILGHFLFGLGANLAGFALGLISAAVAHAIVPSAALFSIDGAAVTGFYPALLGVALLITGLEALLLTVFRFQSVHAQQLMRIAPAFVFFFAMNSLAVDSGAAGRNMLLALGGGAGFAALAACLLAFLALAGIAAGISRAREQS